MGVDGTGDFCHIRVCSEEDVVFKEKSGGGGGGRVGNPGIGAIDCRIECLSLKCKMDSCKQFCT